MLVEKYRDVELVAKRNRIKLARSTNHKRVANEDTFSCRGGIGSMRNRRFITSTKLTMN